MTKNLSVDMRNKIAKKNRQTLLAWNNLFWLSMMFLSGLEFLQAGVWVIGYGLIGTFIEIVTSLLIINRKIAKLDYFVLSFIEPMIIGGIIFLISKLLL